MNSRITVTKKFTFESAHRLYLKNKSEEENKEIYGACNRLHGHSYKLFVTVTGPVGEDGMVVNFTELTKVVNKSIIDLLDHQYLNDVLGDDIPLTCENMLPMISTMLQVAINQDIFAEYQVKEITLYETEKCYATIRIPEE